MKRPIVAAMLAVYLVLFVMKHAGLSMPIISSWLADLLCVPVILSISELIINRYFPRFRNFKISLWHVIFTAAYCSILFEWLLPPSDHRFTADKVDVLMYFAGGLIYWLILRLASKERSKG